MRFLVDDWKFISLWTFKRKLLNRKQNIVKFNRHSGKQRLWTCLKTACQLIPKVINFMSEKVTPNFQIFVSSIHKVFFLFNVKRILKQFIRLIFLLKLSYWIFLIATQKSNLNFSCCLRWGKFSKERDFLQNVEEGKDSFQMKP